ncbi:Pseudouridine 5'-phosphate glycosidase [Olavius algarvensis spirochete endosymbiont]|uniref:pseudouridine-5'-phosphate glycosidase n=1 Tax=Olavius algarvensis spirochete endosymbiont TaxID=260710 RepID=UPI000F2D3CBF|nr:pseudouridine-5'-phosphate glycosidase [Olavius algarvensis spirochete endosymbiont]CAD7843012.1 MAG: Pseudouridine 5'-phosphate glycosidase (EC 4.2.1.70) [Olavius algarvensis spirochete endosymbiont]VDA99284.1 Pseudouridine 5'-phosphate glycosidase [Olavius algarvensis spirochete endosymbiont]
MNLARWVAYSDEVQQAKTDGLPVVALESTIIAHGMPYPANVETAMEVEKIIRDNGAIPATIAIMKGKIRIGLSEDDIDYIGNKTSAQKVSRRDIAIVLAKKRDGATTVAATMICAESAGIEVFVTGGIGGVHKKGEVTMDISADLPELGRTSVTVVCAGAKAILDIGRTMEFLETHGVPVIGYQTDEFPAFYIRSSGYPVNTRVDTPEETAHLIRVQREMGIRGGMVIATPVPEADAMDSAEMQNAIQKSLEEAKEKNVRGKDVTPFLLNRIQEITGGRSLEANIALIKNNAATGARIAVALNSQ